MFFLSYISRMHLRAMVSKFVLNISLIKAQKLTFPCNNSGTIHQKTFNIPLAEGNHFLLGCWL